MEIKEACVQEWAPKMKHLKGRLDATVWMQRVGFGFAVDTVYTLLTFTGFFLLLFFIEVEQSNQKKLNVQMVNFCLAIIRYRAELQHCILLVSHEVYFSFGDDTKLCNTFSFPLL